MTRRFEEILTGRYEGTGRWTDIVGDSKKYRVSHLQFGRENEVATIDFVHDLYEEDDQVVAKFFLNFESDERFSVRMSAEASSPEIGSGHLFDDYCQYLLVIGSTVVENRMVFLDDALRIYGSSSKNKAGRFISWEETLTRIR